MAEESIRHGSDNVFSDLGFADADSHLVKAQLVNRISEAMSDRKLTQTATAQIIGMSQPDLSRLLKGQFRDVSIERLMRALTRLGYEVDIVVRGHDHEVATEIHFRSAAE
jgi:predicted XRE-type DNA-binding protein